MLKELVAAVLASLVVAGDSTAAVKQTPSKTPERSVISTVKTVERTTKKGSVGETAGKDDLFKVDDSDLMYIATTVCEEAGGQSLESCYYVAQVIVNRVKSKSFPDTVTGVLTQKGQYSHYTGNKGREWPSWATKEIKDKCIKAATAAATGTVPLEYRMPRTVVYQSQFQQGKIWKICEDHYYCYG